MAKFKDRAKAPEIELPKICGVYDCEENCDVLVGYKNIPRCSYHYQRDIDTYSGKRRSATSFVYEKGMPRS